MKKGQTGRVGTYTKGLLTLGMTLIWGDTVIILAPTDVPLQLFVFKPNSLLSHQGN